MNIYDQIRVALLPFARDQFPDLDIVDVSYWEEYADPGYRYSSYTYEDPHTVVTMGLALPDGSSRIYEYSGSLAALISAITNV